MVSEGQFPKGDNNVWYASEVNHFFDLYGDVKTYNLAVTTSSAALNFSGVSNKYSILIRNIGYQDCYFNFGATATTSSMILPAGTEVMFTSCTFDDLSAITASSTTELSVAVFVGLNSKTGYKTNSEIKSISATTSTSTVSFTNTTAYKDVLITNVGVSAAFISLSGTAATTDFKLEPRESLAVMTNKSQFAAITAAGTATIRIIGVF
jgi:hypothetical protein